MMQVRKATGRESAPFNWEDMLKDYGCTGVGSHAIAGMRVGGAFSGYVATKEHLISTNGLHWINPRNVLYSKFLEGRQLLNLVEAMNAGVPVEKLYVTGGGQAAVAEDEVAIERDGPGGEYVTAVNLRKRTPLHVTLDELPGRIRNDGYYRVLTWMVGEPLKGYLLEHPEAARDIAYQAARIFGMLTNIGVIYSQEESHIKQSNFGVHKNRLHIHDFKLSARVNPDAADLGEFLDRFKPNWAPIKPICEHLGAADEAGMDAAVKAFTDQLTRVKPVDRLRLGRMMSERMQTTRTEIIFDR